MIAIFEGPQAAGKTTLIHSISAELLARDVPSEIWKVPRGSFPIRDMKETLAERKLDESKVWLVDRFHMSEWVISYATKRVWNSDEEWQEYEAFLKEIDNEMKELGTMIIFVMVSPHVARKRLDDLGKDDVVGGVEEADRYWRWGMTKTRCDCLSVMNNDRGQLRANVQVLSDILEVRWARPRLSKQPPDIYTEE